MKNPFILILILFCINISLYSQIVSEKMVNSIELSYYLPDIQYNKEIPTPESVLGYQVGEWHVSHDQLKYYMEKLAASSDRIIIEEYAKSHEGRALQLLTISSPENLEKIESIRKEHIGFLDPNNKAKKTNKNSPVVIYQGYSIHGNESSGSNAALLVAYYLAAGQDKFIDSLLENSIILLDPCYNPDGLQRFSSWVNRNRAKTLNSDPNDIEFDEVWPGGRTNHYWFDLNRDWLLLTHPESEGRIKNFHKWKPNVLTDHHEMGTNSTFFFQPGVPERTNPNTPEKNQSLTEKIGRFHAKALDELGSLYYSKENFDDFYYGKGSTYPDINGGIGILFEQASSRGHLQESVNGLVSFPFTIRNQVATSLSTQKAAINLRSELLDYQQNFFNESVSLGKNSIIKAYQVQCKEDPIRLERFANILDQHQIELFIDTIDNSIYIPTQQIQYRLLKSMMERVNNFKDSVFYDVSAWTFPEAFNLEIKEINKPIIKLPKTIIKYEKNVLTGNRIRVEKASYAYIFQWNSYNSASALQFLLNKGLKTRISQTEIRADINNRKSVFAKGSIIVPVNNQELNVDEIYSLMNHLSQKYFIDIYSFNSGYFDAGVSMGSPQITPLKNKQAAMLIGEGTNAYDAGEIWHHFDHQLRQKLTKIDKSSLNKVNLSRYDILILPDGNYNEINKSGTEKINKWLTEGGTLISFKSAILWAQQNGFASSKFKTQAKSKEFKKPLYETRSEDRTVNLVGGAIVQVRLDLSHPLAYGYSNPEISVFQKGSRFLEKPLNPYASPINYSENGLISGYMSQKNIKNMAETPAIIVHSKGRGKLICFNFNPLFRGYFWGTNKIFDNALYFGHLIDGSTAE